MQLRVHNHNHTKTSQRSVLRRLLLQQGWRPLPSQQPPHQRPDRVRLDVSLTKNCRCCGHLTLVQCVALYHRV
jgi:hypothetical protein